jgi:hypothetical protein
MILQEREREKGEGDGGKKQERHFFRWRNLCSRQMNLPLLCFEMGSCTAPGSH